LTNTLQKKLDQVKREKALLEQQIEREESSHGKLKTKLTSMRADKNQMEKPKSDNHGGEKHDSMVHPGTILESEEEEEEAENE
jgi:septal ring factor EnvC (AmiA/AmiB activator)